MIASKKFLEGFITVVQVRQLMSQSMALVCTSYQLLPCTGVSVLNWCVLPHL